MTEKILIYKSLFNLTPDMINVPVEFEAPKGAVFLSAQSQAMSGPFAMLATSISIWFSFDPNNVDDLETHQALFLHTGSEILIEKGFKYLDTVLLIEGSCVLHVFLKKNRRF